METLKIVREGKNKNVIGIDFMLSNSYPIDNKDSKVIFDFYLLKTINAGKSNERQEFKLKEYGIYLRTCANYIIRNRYPKDKENEVENQYIIRIQPYIDELMLVFDNYPDELDYKEREEFLKKRRAYEKKLEDNRKELMRKLALEKKEKRRLAAEKRKKNKK